MFVGGIMGFILDNIIFGLCEEWGMVVWNSEVVEVGDRVYVYDFLFGLKKLSFYGFVKYVFFLLYYGDEEIFVVELRKVIKKLSGLVVIL